MKYLQQIIKTKWNYLQKIIKGPASLGMAHDRNVSVKHLINFESLFIKFTDIFHHFEYHSNTWLHVPLKSKTWPSKKTPRHTT